MVLSFPFKKYRFGFSRVAVSLILGAIGATAGFGAQRNWIRPYGSGEGSFWDSQNWNAPLVQEEDAFQINRGLVLLDGLLGEDGLYSGRQFQTRDNNYLGFSGGSTEVATLRIANGGHLITSFREPNGSGGFLGYEFFVGRGLSAGDSNTGKIQLQEGGTLSLGFHMAIGRNSGHGIMEMTGGLLNRPGEGNIYLGWDGTVGATIESYGEFHQSGGEVKFAGGYIYIGSQTAAGVGARGFLEVSNDAKFEAHAVLNGRQGEGSSGLIILKAQAQMSLNLMIIGGDSDAIHGASGRLEMLDQSRLTLATTLTVGNAISATQSVMDHLGGTVQTRDLRVGRNGGNGLYNLSGSSTITGTGFIYVGHGTVRVTSGQVFIEAGTGKMVIDQQASATFASGIIGNGGTGELHLKSGNFKTNGALTLGAAYSFVDVNTQLSGTTARGFGTVVIDGGTGWVESLTIASATGDGRFVQNGGSFTSNTTINIGHSLVSEGEYEMHGGLLTLTQDTAHLVIGRDSKGVFTMSGGEVRVGGSVGIAQVSNANGEFIMTGGKISTRVGTGFYVGETGRGKFTISGNARVDINPNSANGLNIGRTGAAAYGEVFLNGGIINTNVVKRTAGSGFLYFNGGVLQASVNQANFIQGLTLAEVRQGGAILDTQSFSVTVSQALVSGGSNDGGLRKLGTGTLTLTAANTYVGKTEVAQGTLLMGHQDTLAQSKWIEVRSGASLDTSALTQYANLSSNAVVSGSGQITGALTLLTGRSIKIGDSLAGADLSRAGEGIGQLRITNTVTIFGGTSIWFDLKQAVGQKGVAWDHLQMSETFNPFVFGDQEISIVMTEALGSNFDQTQDYTWELARSDWSSLNLNLSLLKLDTTRWLSDHSMGTFSLDLSTFNVLNLKYTFLGVVPEPSRVAYLVVAASLLLGYRRRP